MLWVCTETVWCRPAPVPVAQWVSQSLPEFARQSQVAFLVLRGFERPLLFWDKTCYNNWWVLQETSVSKWVLCRAGTATPGPGRPAVVGITVPVVDLHVAKTIGCKIFSCLFCLDGCSSYIALIVGLIISSFHVISSCFTCSCTCIYTWYKFSKINKYTSSCCLELGPCLLKLAPCHLQVNSS